MLFSLIFCIISVNASASDLGDLLQDQSRRILSSENGRVNLEDVIESRRSARILSDLDSDDIRRALLAEGAVSGIDNDAPVSAFATADGPSEAPAEAPGQGPLIPDVVGPDDYFFSFQLVWATLPFTLFSDAAFRVSYDTVHQTAYGRLGRVVTLNLNYQNPFPTDTDVLPRVLVEAFGTVPAARRLLVAAVQRAVRELRAMEVDLLASSNAASVVTMDLVFKGAEYGGKPKAYIAAYEMYNVILRASQNPGLLSLIYSNPEDPALRTASGTVSARATTGVTIGSQSFDLPTVRNLQVPSDSSGNTGAPHTASDSAVKNAAFPGSMVALVVILPVATVGLGAGLGVALHLSHKKKKLEAPEAEAGAGPHYVSETPIN